MFHDVTDTEPPQIAPPLTALKLSTSDESATGDSAGGVSPCARRTGSSSTDLLDLAAPVLRRGISTEHHLAQQPHARLPGNLINPEFFDEFIRAKKVLEAGQDDLEIPMVIEMLGREGDWVRVRFHIRRYPGAVGSLLHIGRFTRLED